MSKVICSCEPWRRLTKRCSTSSTPYWLVTKIREVKIRIGSLGRATGPSVLPRLPLGLPSPSPMPSPPRSAILSLKTVINGLYCRLIFRYISFLNSIVSRFSVELPFVELALSLVELLSPSSYLPPPPPPFFFSCFRNASSDVIVYDIMQILWDSPSKKKKSP